MAFISNFIATPRIILNDQTCSWADKLVYGVINSLSNNREFCYANNSYFAKTLNVGTKTISKSLSKLNKSGYIIIKYDNGKRKIYLNSQIVSEENGKRLGKKFHNDMEEKFQHTKKYNNTRIINNNASPIIGVDEDGVELWNGKRCESTPCSEEELKEMESILSEFK